jgi:hypothetical protein
MAIELDTYSEPNYIATGSPVGKVNWIVNGIEADATTAKEVKPAPGAGKALYIEKIILQSETAAVDPQLQDSATSSVVIFGPIYTTTSGLPCVVDFGDTPIKLASNVALDLKAAGAGAVFVFVKGFTATG